VAESKGIGDEELKENAVEAIEVVRKESIMYYKGSADAKSDYLKIYTTHPQLVPTIRGWFERGFVFNLIQFSDLTYESNMPYALRFMIDIGIVGAGWIKVPKDLYSIRESKNCISRMQLEVDTDYMCIHSISLDGEYSMIAPLRIMAIDIECLGIEGFPTFDKDSVITIACIIKVHTDKEEDTQRIIFQKGACSAIPGVDVRAYANEKDMLKDFGDFLINYDPDFLIGYNSINFDFPYLLRRGNHLNISHFGFWGRIKTSQSRIKKGKYLSKVMGFRETDEMNIEGRVHLDMLIHMMKESKCSSYTLNSVAYKFLGGIHYFHGFLTVCGKQSKRRTSITQS
jgi:DNA polymerase delta subunit 1